MSAALLDGEIAAGAVRILSLVAALGLALGAVRVRGIGLGIAGVLFVYSIGLQVGSGFLASLRRHGLRLNLLAALVVVLGVLTALGLRFAGGIEAPVINGLSAVSGSEAPSVAYATVYPLSMILRVLSAQLLVMYLVR